MPNIKKMYEIIAETNKRLEKQKLKELEEKQEKKNVHANERSEQIA